MLPVKIEKEIDNVVVAWLYVYWVKLPSRFVGFIEEVNTVEEHRRKGYATELIKAAIGLCEAEGCTCVELTVREDKPEIQEFYKSLGFFDRLNRAYRLNLRA